MRAQFVGHEVWTGLRRNMTMTIAVVATVAISLALFGTGLLIRSEVGSMKGYWDGKADLSVFLCVPSIPNKACQRAVPVSQGEKNKIRQKLAALPQVEHVYYESQQQAYDHYKQRSAKIAAILKPTDLPDSFRVKLKDPDQPAAITAVTDGVRGMTGVNVVGTQDQTLDRFLRVLNGLQWAAIGIAAIQIIAAALLIGNTIRLSAYNRRKETGIMRLVGSSNFYVQLPFLLEGAIAGLVGGAIAAGLLVLAKHALFDRTQHYVGGVGSSAGLTNGALVHVIIISVIVGIALCVATSFLTLRKYLKV